MITLITGLPGHGKTLYSIGLILEQIKEGRQHVYADINDLAIDGVKESPDDWRETPQGSLVVFDECQTKFPADSRGGRSANEQIAALETHRHTNHDLMLITQDPRLIHAHVRRLVGRHHHVMRVFGSESAKVHTMDRCLKIDSRTELENADVQMWIYPKDHYQHYKSAVDHNVKRRIPHKVKVVGVILLIMGGFVLTMWVKSFDFFQGNTGQDVQASDIALVDYVLSIMNWINTPELTDVSGCVSSAYACRCYGPEGNLLDLAELLCRDAMDKPIPIKVRTDHS